jgi:hypothetical protein
VLKVGRSTLLPRFSGGVVIYRYARRSMYDLATYGALNVALIIVEARFC